MTVRRFVPKNLASWRMAAAAGALAVGLAASPALADRPDAWITTKVKWHLLTDEHVKGMAVNVDTTDRRVTLHGRVPSVDMKNRATEVARGVEGVRDVRNLLVVAPKDKEGSNSKAVARANDRQLKTRVGEALKNDRLLKDENITVKSVNKGVVLLTGNADSSYDHQRAIRVAYTVDGVSRVASQIETPNEEADAVIWRAGKTDENAKETTAWDPMVTTKVKLKLLASDEVPGLDVNVDTIDGVVTLFGIVPTQESKRIAGEEAASVKGVVRVQNEIQVVADPQRDAIEASDRKAEERVQARLRAEPSLDDQNVSVKVRDGVARLTGEVAADYQRLAALVTARTTTGVDKVVDDLVVVPAEQRAGRDAND